MNKNCIITTTRKSTTVEYINRYLSYVTNLKKSDSFFFQNDNSNFSSKLIMESNNEEEFLLIQVLVEFSQYINKTIDYSINNPENAEKNKENYLVGLKNNFKRIEEYLSGVEINSKTKYKNLHLFPVELGLIVYDNINDEIKKINKTSLCYMMHPISYQNTEELNSCQSDLLNYIKDFNNDASNFIKNMMNLRMINSEKDDMDSSDIEKMKSNLFLENLKIFRFVHGGTIVVPELSEYKLAVGMTLNRDGVDTDPMVFKLPVGTIKLIVVPEQELSEDELAVSTVLNGYRVDIDPIASKFPVGSIKLKDCKVVGLESIKIADDIINNVFGDNLINMEYGAISFHNMKTNEDILDKFMKSENETFLEKLNVIRLLIDELAFNINNDAYNYQSYLIKCEQNEK